MPRFKVVERRCYDAEYIIDAENATSAMHLEGTIVEENNDAGNSWGHDLLSVEEVDENATL